MDIRTDGKLKIRIASKLIAKASAAFNSIIGKIPKSKEAARAALEANKIKEEDGEKEEEGTKGEEDERESKEAC